MPRSTGGRTFAILLALTLLVDPALAAAIHTRIHNPVTHSSFTRRVDEQAFISRLIAGFTIRQRRTPADALRRTVAEFSRTMDQFPPIPSVVWQAALLALMWTFPGSMDLVAMAMPPRIPKKGKGGKDSTVAEALAKLSGQTGPYAEKLRAMLERHVSKSKRAESPTGVPPEIPMADDPDQIDLETVIGELPVDDAPLTSVEEMFIESDEFSDAPKRKRGRPRIHLTPRGRRTPLMSTERFNTLAPLVKALEERNLDAGTAYLAMVISRQGIPTNPTEIGVFLKERAYQLKHPVRTVNRTDEAIVPSVEEDSPPVKKRDPKLAPAGEPGSDTRFLWLLNADALLWVELKLSAKAIRHLTWARMGKPFKSIADARMRLITSLAGSASPFPIRAADNILKQFKMHTTLDDLETTPLDLQNDAAGWVISAEIDTLVAWVLAASDFLYDREMSQKIALRIATLLEEETLYDLGQLIKVPGIGITYLGAFADHVYRLVSKERRIRGQKILYKVKPIRKKQKPKDSLTDVLSAPARVAEPLSVASIKKIQSAGSHEPYTLDPEFKKIRDSAELQRIPMAWRNLGVEFVFLENIEDEQRRAVERRKLDLEFGSDAPAPMNSNKVGAGLDDEKRDRKIRWILMHQLPRVKALRMFTLGTEFRKPRTVFFTPDVVRGQKASKGARPDIEYIEVPLENIVGFDFSQGYPRRQLVLQKGSYRRSEETDDEGAHGIIPSGLTSASHWAIVAAKAASARAQSSIAKMKSKTIVKTETATIPAVNLEDKILAVLNTLELVARTKVVAELSNLDLFLVREFMDHSLAVENAKRIKHGRHPLHRTVFGGYRYLQSLPTPPSSSQAAAMLGIDVGDMAPLRRMLKNLNLKNQPTEIPTIERVAPSKPENEARTAVIELPDHEIQPLIEKLEAVAERVNGLLFELATIQDHQLIRSWISLRLSEIPADALNYSSQPQFNTLPSELATHLRWMEWAVTRLKKGHSLDSSTEIPDASQMKDSLRKLHRELRHVVDAVDGGTPLVSLEEIERPLSDEAPPEGGTWVWLLDGINKYRQAHGMSRWSLKYYAETKAWWLENLISYALSGFFVALIAHWGILPADPETRFSLFHGLAWSIYLVLHIPTSMKTPAAMAGIMISLGLFPISMESRIPLLIWTGLHLHRIFNHGSDHGSAERNLPAAA